MKTAITITLHDELSANELGALRYLLCDAFGEFANQRMPAEEYLNKRYPDVEGYKWLDREEKLVEIQMRIDLAEKLRNSCAGGIDVAVDHAEEPTTEG